MFSLHTLWVEQLLVMPLELLLPLLVLELLVLELLLLELLLLELLVLPLLVLKQGTGCEGQHPKIPGFPFPVYYMGHIMALLLRHSACRQ